MLLFNQSWDNHTQLLSGVVYNGTIDTNGVAHLLESQDRKKTSQELVVNWVNSQLNNNPMFRPDVTLTQNMSPVSVYNTNGYGTPGYGNNSQMSPLNPLPAPHGRNTSPPNNVLLNEYGQNSVYHGRQIKFGSPVDEGVYRSEKRSW